MFVRNKSVVAAAAAFGREPSGKRAVFIQAVKKRYDDGERASAERSAAKAPVPAENEQGDENPESGVVALIAAIHKKDLLCLLPQELCTFVPLPAALSFYYIVLRHKEKVLLFR